jgi:hypothetical protein
MRYEKSRSPLKIFVFAICFITPTALALAQKPAQTKPTEPADDVIRVNTELVQTDVTVEPGFAIAARPLSSARGCARSPKRTYRECNAVG